MIRFALPSLRTLRFALFAALVPPLLMACGTEPAEEATVPEPAASEETVSPPTAGTPARVAGDPGLAPRSSRGAQAPVPGAATQQGAGIAFDLPASWNAEPPSNSMRMAQASLPGAAGDGQFAAFFFGPGGGGGVDANLQRWAGQIEPANGAAPSRETLEVGGLTVHWIESEGTLKASGMPGMGPAADQPGAALYGAVVEGPGGPWFFKVTGPAETLAAHRDAFRRLLESLRLEQSV